MDITLSCLRPSNYRAYIKNQTVFDAVAITFDMDWAPDWCIQLCYDLCKAADCGATFFATHESSVIQTVRRDERFEVGLHPNFGPDSTQGGSRQEILEYCSRVVPEAVSMRTHRLEQSAMLFGELSRNWPNIINDSSILCPFQPNLSPFMLYAGHADAGLLRIPYFWEDDVAACEPSWDWEMFPLRAGLKVFNFHPVLVALNMKTMDQYLKLKETHVLPQCTENDLKNFTNKDGRGTRTFLEECLLSLGRNSITIKEIGNRVRSGGG